LSSVFLGDRGGGSANHWALFCCLAVALEQKIEDEDEFEDDFGMAKTLWPSPLICEICGICGSNFGVGVDEAQPGFNEVRMKERRFSRAVWTRDRHNRRAFVQGTPYHGSHASALGSNRRLTKRPSVRLPSSPIRINSPGCPEAAS
jgi:hypothetical protein